MTRTKILVAAVAVFGLAAVSTQAEAGWRHHGGHGGWGSSGSWGGSSGGSWGGGSGGSWGGGWHRHRHHGGWGSSGSWGGSSGGSSGGYWGGSSGGSSGSYNGGTWEGKPVAPDAPTPPTGAPTPPTPPGPGADAPTGGNTTFNNTGVGTLSVNVPAEAKVFVNGKPTTSTGTSRVYASYGLRSGLTYNYEIRVDIVRDGQTVSQTRNIRLTSGDVEQLAFDFKAGQSTDTKLAENTGEEAAR